MKLFIYSLFAISFMSCSTPSQTLSLTLPDGNYIIKKNGQKYDVNLKTINDTVFIEKNNITIESLPDYLKSLTTKTTFVLHSFDIDAFTTPFKFRPGRRDMPPQMNTTFNGAFYMGRRSDHFVYGKQKNIKGIERKFTQKTGYGFGAFAGVGSVFISPKVLSGAIDYEYDGFVFEYGTALLISYGNINTGLAIAADALIDRNRTKWIYQNQPWVGIIIGFNLN